MNYSGPTDQRSWARFPILGALMPKLFGFVLKYGIADGGLFTNPIHGLSYQETTKGTNHVKRSIGTLS